MQNVKRIHRTHRGVSVRECMYRQYGNRRGITRVSPLNWDRLFLSLDMLDIWPVGVDARRKISHTESWMG